MLKNSSVNSEKLRKLPVKSEKTKVITNCVNGSDDEIFQFAEKAIGYVFKNKKLLKTALTHKSCSQNKNYERLEFLGDSVLGFLIAEHLYFLSDKREGVLTGEKQKLVSTVPLANAARKISLDKFIFVSKEFKNEKSFKAGAPDSLCEDVYEAVVAAIYLDGGINECESFIKRTLLISENEAFKTGNFIVELQEYAQAKKLGTPTYELVSESGPPHAPLFTTAVIIGGKQIALGSGNSKKLANKQAAERALKKIKERKN